MRLNRFGLLEAGVTVAAVVVIQVVQIAAEGYGRDGDALVYFEYARNWSNGEVPYRDFHPEYPPGSMVLFYLPYLYSGINLRVYRAAFGLEMALFYTALALFVLAHARRLWPDSLLRRAGAVMLYLGSTIALFQFVHRRFDVVPAALVLAALYVRPVIGAGLLGVAASVKLWPLLLLPLFFADVRKETWRSAADCIGAFSVGAFLPVLPFLHRAGTGVLGFLKYHADRGIQIESIWAIPIFILDSLDRVPAKVVWDHGANHVTSPVETWLVPMSTFALVVLTLLPTGLLRVRGTPVTYGSRLQAATAVVLGFLLGGKVLSPQFLLWLSPLAALAAFNRPKRGIWMAAALVLGAHCLTSSIFHDYYVPLCNGPRGLAFAVAGLRVIFFVWLYAMTVLPGAQSPPRGGRG